MQPLIDVDYAAKLCPADAQWLNAAIGGLYKGDWTEAAELGINPSKDLRQAANSDRYGIETDVLTADYKSLEGVHDGRTIGELVDDMKAAKTALRKAGKSVNPKQPKKERKPAKAPKAEPINPGNPKLNETIEQFLARGGGIRKP